MHPERPARIRALRDMLQASDVGPKLVRLTAEPADLADLSRVHDAALLGALEASAGTGYTRFDPDTVASSQSWNAARHAAGAGIQAASAVLAGTLDAALVLSRPPGHHAEPDRAMGFCFVNNIAVAARAVLARGLVKRVAIVDFDVHHGNGTQDIFYEDSSVLYVSSHQYPFYPGTGDLDEIGEGPGAGYTMNLPLAAGHGDATFAAAYAKIVLPKLRWFRPELVLVSAGFDAHTRDPLAKMEMTTVGFAALTALIARTCDELHIPGPVLMLEGGYSLPAIADSVEACLEQLVEPTAVALADNPPPLEMALFTDLRRLHRLSQ
jgi:acetoin utilization deacetylase AcuC-like enzyme